LSNLPAPRQFHTSGWLPGAGLPHDRASRLAARRAFVELKQVFIAAIDSVGGDDGQWLREQIRAAEDPSELWLLRAPVMRVLSLRDEATRQWRQRLRRSLATLFPDTETVTGFGTLAFA
jgi:hypothetical protein